MRITFILLTVVLLSESASAQSKAVATQVTQALEAVKSVGTPAQECLSCKSSSASPEKMTKTSAQDCVESICADPKFSATLLMEAAYHKGVDMTQYNQQIAPLVKSIAKNNSEAELTRLQAALDWLKTAPTYLTDRNVVGIANLHLGTQLFMTAVVESDGRIDFAATRKKYPNLTDQEFASRAYAFSMHLQTFNDLKLHAFQVSAMKLMYPGEKYDKRIAELLTELKTLEERNDVSPEVGFYTRSPVYKHDSSAAVIEANLKKDSATNEDLMALGRALLMQRALTVFRTDMRFNAAISQPLNLSHIADKDFIAATQDQLSTAKERLKNLSKAGENCKDAYILGQGFLPTAAEKTKFNGIIPGVKESFKKGIKKFISAESATPIFAKLDSVKIGYPQTKSEHFQTIKKALEHDAKVMDGWRQRHDAVMKDSNRLMPIYVAIRSRKDPTPNKVLSYLPEVQCLMMMPRILPDSSLQGYDGVLVGPMVMKFGKEAEGILHHELAHQISGAIQIDPKMSPSTKGWYVRSRECLKINHSKAYGQYGDSYREEDWADMIAANTGPKKNFGCSSARMSEESVKAYSEMSMRNELHGDPHSSDLFRVLHVQTLTGLPLPEACKKAVNDKGQKAEFQNCALK